ncbi:MAG: hypothetical protein HY902_17725 [Deltaproteobacteria bacterium]|nr:hypothetical protein [Deltaproteobacteria bacterium]
MIASLQRRPGAAWTGLRRAGLALLAVIAATALGRPALAQAQSAAGARLDVQYQAQVDETYLLITVEAKIAGDVGQAIDLDAHPLRLPLLAPMIGGAVLDHGALPNGAQSVEVEGVAPLRVDKQDGGLLVRGTLKAGEVGTARARLVVGFASSHLDLGIVGTGSETWASLVVLMAPPTRVRVAASRPARVSAAEQGNERLVGASLAQGLQRGETATFSLDDLPASPAMPRRVLSGLALFAAVAAAWYGLRQRRRAEAAAASQPGGARQVEPA